MSVYDADETKTEHEPVKQHNNDTQSMTVKQQAYIAFASAALSSCVGNIQSVQDNIYYAKNITQGMLYEFNKYFKL